MSARLPSSRCVVTNRTDRAIEIAERYDGKQIALIDHSHCWPLRLWDRSRDRPEPEMVVIEPGQQRVLFEYRIRERLGGGALQRALGMLHDVEGRAGRSGPEHRTR